MRVKACPPNPRNANGEIRGWVLFRWRCPTKKLCAPNAWYGRRASPAPRLQGHLAVTSLHLTVVRRSSVLLGLPIGLRCPVDPSGVRLTWAKRGAIALSAIDNKVTTKVEENGASVSVLRIIFFLFKLFIVPHQSIIHSPFPLPPHNIAQTLQKKNPQPTSVIPTTHKQTSLEIPHRRYLTLPLSPNERTSSPNPPVNFTPAEALARRHLSISPTAIVSSPLCASPSPNPPLQQALVNRLCPQRPPPPPSRPHRIPTPSCPVPAVTTATINHKTKVPPPLTF